MAKRRAFVGLDVHTESIAVAIAEGGRLGEVRVYGTVGGDLDALDTVVRAREDAMEVTREAKQRLKAFILRHGLRYRGRAGWTILYRRWVAGLTMPDPAPQIALQEYLATVEEGESRVARLTEQLRELVPQWRWAPVVEALQALRGVSVLTATGLVAEIGDVRRFTRARE